VAANRAGADALLSLARSEGEDTVRHFMASLKEVALAKVSEALERVPDGTYEATETMDDGSCLCVRVEIEGARARIDFAGTSGRHPGNLNATPAVVRSVVLYVLRLLIREPFPLNEGIMEAVTIDLPAGMLNPPFTDDPGRAPAVVGGNVETSQRLAGCIIRALGLMSGSQATMNNVVFGTDRYSYYETICGGAGAGKDFDGASAVHTHMTNTLITDPEVLERRYPVRLDRFAVRRGSGGNGAHRGGDGAIREMTFLEPMSLSVLGQHRTEGPYALAGGKRGEPARVFVDARRGERVELGSSGRREVQTGDRLVVETPGGGGYGPPTPKH
jgi:5-oxoprolinase (ATP-hydrolysing)